MLEVSVYGWLACCFGAFVQIDFWNYVVKESAHLMAAGKQREKEEEPGSPYLLQGYIPDNFSSTRPCLLKTLPPLNDAMG